MACRYGKSAAFIFFALLLLALVVQTPRLPWGPALPTLTGAQRRRLPGAGLQARTPRVLAVVVQGPASESYTQLLLQSFQAWGGGCGGAELCVFSGWQGEGGTPVARAYAAAGWGVVLPDPPAHPGVQNVNRQLVGKHAGLLAARRAGATHAVVFRGDMELRHPADFVARVVGTPARLTTVAWIRYLTEYVVAGPIEDLLELFSALQAPGDERFAELFIMDSFAARRNLTHQQLCHSLGRWVDHEGLPVGANELPEGMLFWRKDGQPPEDLALLLRHLTAPGDACNGLLPPGCVNACPP